MRHRRPFLSFGVAASATMLLVGQAEAYLWGNVAIGGSGYVTGVVASPAERDLVYLRTDNGGAYRYQASSASWLPLMDVLPYADRDLYGVESIAPDPTNANVVYAACGKYIASTSPDGDILKSTNKGATWQKAYTGLKMGGDEDLRWSGERLAVDPANANVLYFGTRADGLWRSESASASGSWLKMYSFPSAGAAGTGLTFVTVDKLSASGSRSQKIYAGCYGTGVYLTTNAGTNWTLIWSDTKPMRCAVGIDGTAYMTSGNGTLGIYSGSVLRIARPGAKPALCAVTVHPTDPKVVYAGSWGWSREEIYRSVDGGTTWTSINDYKIVKGPTFTSSFHDQGRWASGLSALAVDPFSPNRVWMTDGFLVWRTDDVTATTTSWDSYVKGIEQTVVNDLLCPTTGAPLLSGLSDVAGFRHVNIFAPPPKSFNSPFVQQGTSGLDYAALNPNTVARVGNANGAAVAAYSSDNAQTWTNFPTRPTGAIDGQVAVSADGAVFLWASTGAGGIYRTADQGRTWQKSSGGPASANLGNRNTCRLVADRADANLFYVNERTALYRSTDKGVSWQRTAAALEHADWNLTELQTVTGRQNDVWRSVESRGLFRSTNRGDSFTKISGVATCLSFGFGRAAQGASHPAIYVLGTTTGSLGMYRSIDMGSTWTRIGGDFPTLGCFPGHVAGDMQVYGRVYVGSSGRGIFYGEVEGTPHPMGARSPKSTIAPVVGRTGPPWFLANGRLADGERGLSAVPSGVLLGVGTGDGATAVRMQIR